MQQRIMQQECNWYFAFGKSQKSSLISQFCRENQFVHLKNASKQDFSPLVNKDVMAQANPALFYSVQTMKKEIITLFIGKQFTEEELKIKHEYSQLGRAISIPELDYSKFSRTIYPNIIIVYGPDSIQNYFLCASYFNFIDYKFINTPIRANQLLAKYDKSLNYILNGLIPQPQELTLLEQFFHLRIVHLRHDKNQLPGNDDYFQKQASILPILKSKPYFISIDGTKPNETIEQQIGQRLCPQLIYVNAPQKADQQYLNAFIQQTNSLLLNLDSIWSILKRKPVTIRTQTLEKVHLLTSIIYRDLNLKQIYISGFPLSTQECISFEKRTRKIKKYVNLQQLNGYQNSKVYTSPIYYLQRQQRIHPNKEFSLQKQLQETKQYWLVTGASCTGKSSVSKYIASEYGFKHVQYDAYVQGIKEKLIAPEDGEELPLRKILAHFKSLIEADQKITYLIDGLSLDAKDIENWVSVVGVPSVLNLKVEQTQLVKRTRKKNQADLAAQVGEEELNKIKQTQAKNADWIQKLSQKCPESTIYQIDYNQSQLLSQKLVDTILKPRIFLVQSNNTLTYQNIAIKHNLGFINLKIHPLQSCAQLVKKSKKRDIILCYYNKFDQKLVSQDLYWIERNLGTIRYLGIWSPQNKQIQEEFLSLERPAKPQKKKIINQNGEEQEAKDEPPAEEEEGEKKKVLDIYAYEWTKPIEHKNLSQWFFKLKKNVQERKNSSSDCFSKFGEVLSHLNQGKNLNIYEVISD